MKAPMKGAILLALFALLLLGCTESQTKDQANPAANATVNATVSAGVNASGITASPTPAGIATQAPANVAQADLCVVSRPGIAEIVLLDRDRYVFEGRVNRSISAEMLFVNDTLYFHILPPVGGCDWASFTAQDRATVKKFGDVLILSFDEMKSRIPPETCRKVPLLEKVFTLPQKTCTVRELLLRGMARQG